MERKNISMKTIIIFITCLLLLIIIVFLTFSPSNRDIDFCAKTKKRILPQQRIDIVIDDVLKHQDYYAVESIEKYRKSYFSRLKSSSASILPDSTDIPLGEYELINYKNKEEFIRENPQCCKLVEGLPNAEGTLAEFDMESNYGEEFVHLVYYIKYIDSKGVVKKFLIDTFYLAVSNCGDHIMRINTGSCLYYKRLSKNHQNDVCNCN